MNPTAFAQLNPSTDAAAINMLIHRAAGCLRMAAIYGPNWRYWSDEMERWRRLLEIDPPWDLPFPGSDPTPRPYCTTLQEAEWLAEDVGITPESQNAFDICCQMFSAAWTVSAPEEA